MSTNNKLWIEWQVKKKLIDRDICTFSDTDEDGICCRVGCGLWNDWNDCSCCYSDNMSDVPEAETSHVFVTLWIWCCRRLQTTVFDVSFYKFTGNVLWLSVICLNIHLFIYSFGIIYLFVVVLCVSLSVDISVTVYLRGSLDQSFLK